MAFISIIVMLLLFFILMLGIVILFLSSIVGMILGIVFACMYVKEKKNGASPKKWKKRASILCGAAGVLLFLPFAVEWFSSMPHGTVEIETPEGKVEAAQAELYAFHDAIRSDDWQKVASILEENPVFIHYTTSEGNTPLGAAICYSSPAVVEYLLQYGVDVNDAGSETSVALICKMSMGNQRRLNVEILNLLLDYHPDVNRPPGEKPPVQYVIEYILEDSDISNEDMDLLKRFLEEGADLSAVNSEHMDTLQYFEEKVVKYNLGDSQNAEVEEMRRLLHMYL